MDVAMCQIKTKVKDATKGIVEQPTTATKKKKQTTIREYGKNLEILFYLFFCFCFGQ